MATEEGIVIAVDENEALVKATKSGACESCSARSSCHVLGGSEEMEVSAINAAGAVVDDRVIMAFEDASLLKAAFLLYIVPILVMILGAVLGQVSAPPLGLSPAIVTPAAAALFLVAAVVFVRSKGNSLAGKDKYRPRIVRILS